MLYTESVGLLRFIVFKLEERRLAKRTAWRKTLGPGDRVWVVVPTGNVTRLTIARRVGDRFDLLLYVDAADGANCLLGIHESRLFPERPRDVDVEVAQEIAPS